MYATEIFGSITLMAKIFIVCEVACMLTIPVKQIKVKYTNDKLILTSIIRLFEITVVNKSEFSKIEY
jgi:hypothetical protein